MSFLREIRVAVCRASSDSRGPAIATPPFITMNLKIEHPIQNLTTAVYSVPTAAYTEADGTETWNKTNFVWVEIQAAGKTGLGYSYASKVAGDLIMDVLKPLILGKEALDIPICWNEMIRAVRNLGREGVASMAISAIDNALWDLKAKILELPLCKLLGQHRNAVPIYGSGGFTSESIPELQRQLSSWVNRGIPRVKMKIGGDLRETLQRVEAARIAIGEDTELYVDANGAYSVKQALEIAERVREHRVSWFEEPVSSDNLRGLAQIRERAPAGMEIAAGEYGFDSAYFEKMLEASAVDVAQIDATRCLGVSGFIRAASVCDAMFVPISAHTAPQIHAHIGCCVPHFRHVEYFFDHARIERMLFDGALLPKDGTLLPDMNRPGLGIELKKADARRFAA